MTKEEWQQLHSILTKIHSDFQSEYYTSEKGRNAKIRAAAKLKVDSSISLADFHITRNLEAYVMLTGEQGSDYSRALMYDEFKQAHYFGRDLSTLLRDIEKKIERFNH